MRNEQKKRLEKFKKVSGYLLPLTSLAMVMLAAGAIIAIAIVVFKPQGETNISAVADILTSTSKIEGYQNVADWFFDKRLDWLAKSLLTSFIGVTSYFAIRALFHFNRLLDCFYEDEIFNRNALIHGRKAFKSNLCFALSFILSYLVLLIISTINLQQSTDLRIAHFFDVLIGIAIDFGFYCLILWALGMGTELSEESELTI